jgi:hypothetical protein
MSGGGHKDISETAPGRSCLPTTHNTAHMNVQGISPPAGGRAAHCLPTRQRETGEGAVPPGLLAVFLNEIFAPNRAAPRGRRAPDTFRRYDGSH